MYQLPAALFAVIETGTWTVEEVRAWADAVIQAVAVPARWVLDLSLARSRPDASAAATRALEEGGGMLPDDLPELMIGLLYLRLQRGDLSKRDFVAEVGDVADAYQASVFDSERWAREATHLDSADSLRAELAALSARASETLSILKDGARLSSDPFIAGRPGG